MSRHSTLDTRHSRPQGALNTQAVSGVKNHGRQHGNSARSPIQPTPPTAQAAPRAARPATHRPLPAGDAGRTLYGTQLGDAFGRAGWSGTQEALTAARAGNVKLVDELELAWLNAWGPKPTPPEDVPAQLLEENGWRLYAIEILHGGDETMIEWGYVQPCPRCWRAISKRKGCRKCEGWGYLNGGGHEECAIWRFQTDTELRIVPDSLSNFGGY